MSDQEANEERERERKAVDEAVSLSPRMIYEIIRRTGDEELARPTRSLIWSGIGAGVLISFSVLGEAIFRTYLPGGNISYLVENLGYSFGFLLVILGRMQLFTENTITTVLPVMVNPKLRMFYLLFRLWVIVLAANLVGAFAAAMMMAHTSAIPAEILPAIISLSEHATGMGASTGFAKGIPAGVLIAAIVWTLPQAEEASFFVILVFTWLLAVGDFTHIVAGSVEMAFLMVSGRLDFWPALTEFFLPVLAGNVVGGTAIFAVVTWGQVKDELLTAEGKPVKGYRGDFK